jgi:hypothetical protein
MLRFSIAALDELDRNLVICDAGKCGRSHRRCVTAVVLFLFAAWGSLTGASARADESPVKVLKAVGGFYDSSNGDYSLVCGVSFENVSSRPIVAIKWHIKLEDAFNSVLDTQTVDSYGSYAPGVIINPKRAMNGNLETDSSASDTNAWTVYKHETQDRRYVSVRVIREIRDKVRDNVWADVNIAAMVLPRG